MVPHSSCPPTEDEAMSQAVEHSGDSCGEVLPLLRTLRYKKCMKPLASLPTMQSSRGNLFLKETQNPGREWSAGSPHAQLRLVS